MRLGTMAVGLAFASVLWFLALHNFHSNAAPGNPGEHHSTDAAHGGSAAYGRVQQLAGFSARPAAARAGRPSGGGVGTDFYEALEAAEASVKPSVAGGGGGNAGPLAGVYKPMAAAAAAAMLAAERPKPRVATAAPPPDLPDLSQMTQAELLAELAQGTRTIEALKLEVAEYERVMKEREDFEAAVDHNLPKAKNDGKTKGFAKQWAGKENKFLPAGGSLSVVADSAGGGGGVGGGGAAAEVQRARHTLDATTPTPTTTRVLEPPQPPRQPPVPPPATTSSPGNAAHAATTTGVATDAAAVARAPAAANGNVTGAAAVRAVGLAGRMPYFMHFHKAGGTTLCHNARVVNNLNAPIRNCNLPGDGPRTLNSGLQGMGNRDLTCAARLAYLNQHCIHFFAKGITCMWLPLSTLRCLLLSTAVCRCLPRSAAVYRCLPRVGQRFMHHHPPSSERWADDSFCTDTFM